MKEPKSNQFTAVYEKQGKYYIGYVEEIPGANAQGKTLSEVKKNLKEAILLIIETNRIISLSGRQNSTSIREPITVRQ
ncbi:MAG: hypothetical protein ACD_62C00168G0003 [uncultured bacterium]|nr:MAG: hypothetical protein ACD_62C00168G0003 [uncultured bacterium]HLD45348.1 type II toxin-antitoxin system HicB family antitoxin [bacterium]